MKKLAAHIAKIKAGYGDKFKGKKQEAEPPKLSPCCGAPIDKRWYKIIYTEDYQLYCSACGEPLDE